MVVVQSCLDVTIRSYALVRAIAGFQAFELIKLINILRNQVTLNPVAGDKR
jgi:hypothetical protein